MFAETFILNTFLRNLLVKHFGKSKPQDCYTHVAISENNASWKTHIKQLDYIVQIKQHYLLLHTEYLGKKLLQNISILAY